MVVVVNRTINDKIESIPRIDLRTATPPPEGGNYLLIGSDSRQDLTSALDRQAFGDPTQDQSLEGQRSDTIMVVHIEPRAQKTLVVSFPRDLWVNIPGHGMAKINAAFNYGPQAVIDTLNYNFDIAINHYIELNFKSFVGLVDIIGSVPVYIPYAAYDVNSGFDVDSGGCRSLGGTQSLQYVRARSMQYRDDRTGRYVSADLVPDISRIFRQQEFMRTLAGLAVAKSLDNPFTANQVADEIVSNLKVDDSLDKGSVFDIIDAFRTINPEDTSALDFETLPWRGGPNQGGQQVLYANADVAAPILERLRTFNDEPPPPKVAPGAVRLRIVNTTARNGLAQAAMDRFTQLGFVGVGTNDASTARADVSEVRYAPGAIDKGKLVLRFFDPAARLVPADLVGADVEIVLGSQFTDIVIPADRATPPSTQVAATPDAEVPVVPTPDAEVPLAILGLTPAAASLPPPAPRVGC
jgi:LCP family protein required for cell wall assembly